MSSSFKNITTALTDYTFFSSKLMNRKIQVHFTFRSLTQKKYSRDYISRVNMVWFVANEGTGQGYAKIEGWIKVHYLEQKGGITPSPIEGKFAPAKKPEFNDGRKMITEKVPNRKTEKFLTSFRKIIWLLKGDFLSIIIWLESRNYFFRAPFFVSPRIPGVPLWSYEWPRLFSRVFSLFS